MGTGNPPLIWLHPHLNTITYCSGQGLAKRRRDGVRSVQVPHRDVYFDCRRLARRASSLRDLITRNPRPELPPQTVHKRLSAFRYITLDA